MADPVPLTDPSGSVHGYLCSLCTNLHGGGVSYNGPMDEAQLAERRRDAHRDAANCCRCRRCKKTTSEGARFYFVCAACEPAEQAERDEIGRRADEAAAHRESAWSEAAKLSKSPSAASALASCMSAISEDYYCAGWLIGLEFELWGFVKNGPGRFGMGTLTQAEVDSLLGLSEAAGGWCAWSEEARREVFVPLVEWERRFAAHEAEVAAHREPA